MDPELEVDLNAQLNNTDPEPTDPEPTDPVDPDPSDPEPTDPDPSDPEPEDHRPSRAQQRIQRLASEREQERVARERAETEARMLREQLQRMTAPPPKEDELDPDERWRRDANAAIRRTEMMAADMSDKADFLSKYSSDPEVLAMKDEIEQRLTQLRTQGGNAPRENILKFIMGEKALQRRSKAPAVRKQAAERVNAAKGAPLGTKSNVAPARSEPSLYERLKDQPL